MVELLEAIVAILTYPFYILGRIIQTIILLPVYIITALKGDKLKFR